MAFRIPDFTALPEVNPRPSGQLPVYPQEDPGAAGLAAFGKGVASAGGALVDISDARQKLNESNATLDLVNRLVPLHTQISTETDPNKIAELRGQYDTLLQTSAQAIDDPARRQAWMASHAKTILQAHADADKRLTGLDRDQAMADGRARLDTTIRTGALSDDPNAVSGTLAAVNDNLEWMQKYGAISPEQRYALGKQASRQLITGRADHLINQGRPDEALKLIDENPTELDPGVAEALRHKAETRGAAIRVDGAVNRALGLAPALPPVSGGGEILSKYAAGNAVPGGPSSVEDVHPAFASRIDAMAQAMPPEIRDKFKIISGFRDAQRQAEVNPSVKNSRHMHGMGVDTTTDPDVLDWINANGAQFGVGFPLKNDPKETNHLEPLEGGQRIPGDQVAAWAAKNGPAGGAAPDRVDNWEVRNNNFGGLRKVGSPAAGPEAGGFQAFATPEEGVAAISNQLDRYASGATTGKPLTTIRDIVSTWAPPNENQTDALIARAAKITGFSPDQPLNLSDPAVKAKMIEATIRNEQGGKLPVAPALIAKVAAGQSGTQPLTNRSGLPLPSEVAAAIMRDPTLRNEQERYQAMQRYEMRYKAEEATQAQLERIQAARQKQALDARITQIQKDAYSDNPSITARDIVNDPTFNSDPKLREHMIGFINNPPGSGIPAPQSYAAAQSIIDRIRLPEGDPNKITSENQIYDNMRKLNRDDLNFVLGKFKDLSSPGENRFGHRLEEFFNGTTPQIDRSGVLPGLPQDAKGKSKAFEYRRMVEDQIKAYRDAGKNPDDLLNPKKPDYLGAPEVLKPFKRTFIEALADFQTDNNGPLGAATTDLSTPDKLKAAVAGGKISREQGEAEALRRGWIRPAPAPEAARPDLMPLGR